MSPSRTKPPCDLCLGMVSWLRGELDHQRITYAAWAKRIGTTSQYVNAIMNGRASLSVDRLEEWAAMLGCTWKVELLRPSRQAQDEDVGGI